jgi:hypothetical protein
VHGDATQRLDELLGSAQIVNAVIFLDAHICGAGTVSGDVPDPVLGELEVLARHRDKCAAIIVDDFRSFGVEVGFPEKHTVLAAASERFCSRDWRIWIYLDLLVIERIVPGSLPRT